jgi:glyoxylase-like metal-dependent hydrolase (beta-lactamase superfamily II)
MRARYGIDEPEHVLLANLAALDVTPEQIDVIVLSHLHFDHAGGLLTAWAADTAPALAFPRASYVVGKAAWDRAGEPHPRDRASFIPALQRIVEATGCLEVVDDASGEGVSNTLGSGYRLHRSDGHTPGLTLLEVPSADGAVVFAADLIPGRPWIHLPVTMGYDRAPELLIDEKQALLEDLVARNGRLFLTHDPEVALCRVVRTPRGDFAAGEEWTAPKRMPL